jgi:hypothetical protein
VLRRSRQVASSEAVWRERNTALEWDAGGGERLATRAEQQEILLALLREAQVGERRRISLRMDRDRIYAPYGPRWPISATRRWSA